MPRVALIGTLVYLLLAFGLRTLLHFRRTGRTGWAGVSGAPGSVEWWGGVLFVVAIVAGVAAPVGAVTGALPACGLLDGTILQAMGLVLFVVGGVATLWAQSAMGDSWRIGVEDRATTALVAKGPFRWVRNPIFTSMLAATVGLALLVPNGVALVAVLALVAALELQVRLVEEPYLLRVHGDRYRRYAERVGRFLPGIGRLAASRRAV